MDTTKVVYAIIGITVAVIVTASVLLPTLSDVTAEGAAGESYATLLGVIATMVIVAIVMAAVRLMGGKN